MNERVRIGSRWKDNDPRGERIVEVVEVIRGRVKIRPVSMTGNPGYARTSETAIERFGRKGRSGFSPVPTQDHA